MSLFENAPTVLYNYTDQHLDPKIYTAKNLWRRNDIRGDYISSLVLMDEYLIREGDTPESISFNFYNRVDFGWTIMVANNITNYHDQWPRTAQALNEYVYEKYEEPMAVMMYETTEVVDALNRKIVKAGLRVPSNYQVTYFDGTASAGVTVNPVRPITYYQYEERLNSEKEEINIIKPSYIEEFARVYVTSLHRGGSTVIGQSRSEIKID
tara:strand:+ start:1665 stop:2294 length:630 start_codon:yes stop_codon:yes gene_type:complete